MSDTLTRATYRTVLVGGVEVELLEGGWPAPTRVPLGDWAEAGWYSAEQITRLHLAGVESLPLYAGDEIDFEEVG